MDKLIENARSQFKQFGEVRMTIYPNKSVNDCYDIVENSLEIAIDTISYYYQSIIDDISVSHANAI
jgi:hypothetical protein